MHSASLINNLFFRPLTECRDDGQMSHDYKVSKKDVNDQCCNQNTSE